MAAQLVSTSTSANATYEGGGHMVCVASDGTACVIYYDGTSMVYRSAASPYSTWSSPTTLPSSGANRFAASAVLNPADDSIDVAYHISGTSLVHVKLTKSGSAWAAGTQHTVTATGASGSSGEPVWIGRDGSGRLWVVGNQSNTTWQAWYSSDGGVTWNSSITGATMASSAVAPWAAICGNYLVVIWGENTNGNMTWRRLDTTGVLTSWSAAQNVQLGNAGGFGTFWNGDYAAFAADGNGKGVAVWSDGPVGFGSGISAAVYDPSTDTWGHYANLDTLSGGNADGNVCAVNANGDVSVFFPEYAAATSFSLQYATWDHSTATWGAKTQLEASGTNIANPNAGYGNGLIGVSYTIGTASPWSVEFDTLSVGGGGGTVNGSGVSEGVGGGVGHASISPHGAPSAGVGSGQASGVRISPYGGVSAGIGQASALASIRARAGTSTGVGSGIGHAALNLRGGASQGQGAGVGHAAITARGISAGIGSGLEQAGILIYPAGAISPGRGGGYARITVALVPGRVQLADRLRDTLVLADRAAATVTLTDRALAGVTLGDSPVQSG